MDENNLNFENSTADMQTSAVPVQPAAGDAGAETYQNQPQYTQPQYTQPQYAQPQYAQQAPAENLYGAQQAPVENPYGVQQVPAQNPYGAQQAPVQNPYGAQQAPVENPYGAQQAPAQNPYDAQQAPVQNPYDAQQAPAQNPYGAQQVQPQYIQYQQQAQESFLSGQPLPQETPYGQPMENPYASSPVNGQEIPEIKVKKKHTGRKILIGFLIFLAVAGLGIGGMFIFAKDYTLNLWSRMTKSDAEYLAWVLEKNSEKLPKEELQSEETESFGKRLLNGFNTFGEKLNSGLQVDVTGTGKIGADITSMIGIPEIDKVSIGFTGAAKNKAYGFGIKLNYAGQDFITLNGAVDTAERKIYIQIPEFDSRMLDVTSVIGEEEAEEFFNEIEELGDDYGSILEELEEALNVGGLDLYGMPEMNGSFSSELLDSFAKFMEKAADQYAYEIVSEMGDSVTSESDYELSLGNNKATCTKMSLKLKGKDFEKFFRVVSDKAKTDEDFYAFVSEYFKMINPSLKVERDELGDLLDKTLEKISEEFDFSQIGITFDCFVDNKGKIIGEGLAGDISTLGKASITLGDFSEDDNTDLEVNVKVAGMNVCNISVEGTNKDGKKEGTVDISVPIASMLGAGNGAKPSFAIEYYEDRSVENKYDGHLTFRVKGVDEITQALGIKLSDYSLTVSMNNDESKLTVGVSADKGSENELTTETTFAVSENVTLPLGARFGAQVVDFSDTEAVADYISAEKLMGFAENLEAKADATGLSLLLGLITSRADIDLQSILGQAMSLTKPHKKYIWSLADIDPDKVYEYTYAGLADYVSAPDYNNIPVRAGEIEVPQEEIDEYISELMPEGEWDYVDVDTIEEYDLVNISLIPSFMGIEISDYIFDSFDLIVGENYVTDGFDVQLEGRHVGENFVISARTNEAYGEYEGYMVDFDVTVNSIQRYSYVTPELTDEIAVSIGYENAQALYEEAYQYVYDTAYANRENTVIQEILDYFRSYTSYNTEKSKALTDLVSIEFDFYEQYAEFCNTTLYDMYGYSDEEIEEILLNYFYGQGDDILIYANLIKRAGISITGRELISELQDMAGLLGYYSVDEMLANEYQLPTFMDEILLDRLFDMLLDNVGM